MIVTLCGSAKFEDLFKEWNEKLTLQGHVVFSLAVYPSDKNDNKNWYTPEQKAALDEAHKNKIDASDAILVINPDGYVGESTLSEIEFAIEKGKKIYRTYFSEKDVHGNGFGPNVSQKVCGFRGCYDYLQKPPCALCYE